MSNKESNFIHLFTASNVHGNFGKEIEIHPIAWLVTYKKKKKKKEPELT